MAALRFIRCHIAFRSSNTLPVLTAYCFGFLTTIFGLAVHLSAQESDRWSYQKYSMAQGLSNPMVTACLEDRQGFMWFGTSTGLNRFDGYEFKVFIHDPRDPFSLPCANILSLAEAPDGIIWVGTLEGLFLFDPRSEKFSCLSTADGSVDYTTGKIVNKILFAADGKVWLALVDGIARWDPSDEKMEFFPGTNYPEPVWLGQGARDFGIDKQARVWIAGYDRIGFWHPDAGKFHYLEKPEKDGKEPAILRFHHDRSGQLWVGTRNGLFVLDSLAGQFREITIDHSPQVDFSVENISEDRHRNLWIGTSQGVYRREGIDGPIRRVFPGYAWAIGEDRQGGVWVSLPPNLIYAMPGGRKFQKHSVGGLCGFSIVEDDQGGIWSGTLDGAYCFHDGKGKLIRPSGDRSVGIPNWAANNVKSIIKDEKGQLWMGLQDRRLVVYQPENGRKDEYPLGDGAIPLAACWDDRGRLWFGTYSGLFFLDTVTRRQGVFQPENVNLYGLQGKMVTSVLKDHSNRIWVGTMGGLYRIDPETEDVEFFQKEDENVQGLSTNEINTLLEDSRGRLWIATNGGGLHLFEGTNGVGEKARFRNWSTYNSDLPGNFITTIQEGEKGVLWMTAGAYIVRFDTRSGTMKSYDQADGLYDDIYNVNASLKASDGRIYLLTKGGLAFFHPDSLVENRYRPPVRITGIFVRNKRLPLAGSLADTLKKGSPLPEAPEFTNRLVLGYDQNDFSFQFTTLNFDHPHKNRYKYRLVGYDDNWQELSGGRRLAQFTNIDPGGYRFEVKGSNNDGYWSEEPRVMTIRILPPWYWNWWSKLTYFLLLAGVAVLLYRLLLRRRLALAEAQRLAELDETKSRLYTNITHEFRTPLTVLLGMADRVTDDPKKWYHEGMTLIKRQGRHLLHLVNQLLDISKLESGNMRLEMAQGEVVAFLKYLTDSFHSLAENKDIRLHLLAAPEEIVMDYNPDGLGKIVSNLLSNAIKFTPPGGDVYLLVEPAKNDREGAEILRLQVKDTGIGIPDDQLPRIFDRFYQVDSSSIRAGEGAGIGLALTRELVRLMGGQITVQSKVGEGSVFTVLLPLRREAPLAKDGYFAGIGSNGAWQEKPEAASLGADVDAGEDRPVALLVEDHADVLTYLRACLQDAYRLETARDGREGISKAIELVPDIIISDVMMPEVDGFELTRSLKEDERTSHIPILLLTAKAGRDSRLEGLDRGADAYLVKPFDRKELEVRLRKLIDLRRKLLERYSGQDGIRLPVRKASGRPTPDERFLNRLSEVLDAHLEEEDFGINQLCETLGISRIQLHRKLKALAGTSASHFIRNYRLEKGRELLETTDLNISEVAYRVGFRNHSYFTESFRERYGMAPSEYRDQP